MRLLISLATGEVSLEELFAMGLQDLIALDEWRKEQNRLALEAIEAAAAAAAAAVAEAAAAAAAAAASAAAKAKWCVENPAKCAEEAL